jgi:hypothetical protein
VAERVAASHHALRQRAGLPDIGPYHGMRVPGQDKAAGEVEAAGDGKVDASGKAEVEGDRAHARRLQFAMYQSPTISQGVRTALAMRFSFGDQGPGNATSQANFDRFLDYLVDTMGVRSFGKMVFNVTRPACAYVLVNLTLAAGAASSGAITNAAHAALRTAE